MYGDFLVPNNTNVDNAITTGTGAKWEKLYTYTFEDSHAESFEFPTDIDGTPLNLNGLIIEIHGRSTGSISCKLNVNGNDVGLLTHTTSTSTQVKSYFRATINNDMLTIISRQRDLLTDTKLSTFENTVMNVNSIKEFKLISDSVFDSGMRIDFYVRRDV